MELITSLPSAIIIMDTLSSQGTIERTYSIFIVWWLSVHSLAVPNIFFVLGSISACCLSHDKPNLNYGPLTQSNPNEQNIELNFTSPY